MIGIYIITLRFLDQKKILGEDIAFQMASSDELLTALHIISRTLGDNFNPENLREMVSLTKAYYENPNMFRTLVIESGDHKGRTHLVKSVRNGNVAWAQKLIELFDKMDTLTIESSQFMGKECYICYEPFEESHIVYRVPCNGNHIFHKHCIDKWVSINSTCPYCRDSIAIENITGFLNKSSCTDKNVLYYAIKLGNLPFVESLIQKGAFVQYKSAAPLHLAAGFGHRDLITYFLAKGENIEVLDAEGHTPLYYAVCYAKPPIVQMLLDNSANVFFKYYDENDDGRHQTTALHIAISKCNTKVVQTLLHYFAQHNISIDTPNSRGKSPLTVAFERYAPLTIRELLDAGADLTKLDKFHPLFAALRWAKSNSFETYDDDDDEAEFQPPMRENMFEVLLQKMDVLFERSKESYSAFLSEAFEAACKEGHADAVKYFLKKYPDLSISKDCCPFLSSSSFVDFLKTHKLLDKVSSLPGMFLQSVKSNNKELVQLYLEKGYDPNVVDDKGNSAAHFAKSLEMLILLEKYNTKFTLINDNGETPLHTLMGAYKLSSEKLSVHAIQNNIPILSSREEDDEEVDDDEPIPTPVAPRRTVLDQSRRRVVAVVKKKVIPKDQTIETSCVIFLLEKGVEIDAKTNEGLTALQIAAHGNSLGHLDVVKLLCIKGANINECSSYKAPVHIAMLNYRPAMVDVLVRFGADLHKFYDGTTILHYAFYHKNKTLISTILEKKYPIDSRDAKGETAFGQFIVYQSENDMDFLDFLIKSGVDLNLPVHFYPKYFQYPLHLAACRGQIKVLQELVKGGANLYQKDEDGKTIAHIVASKARDDVMEFLYKQLGMDLTLKDNDGYTPLHEAVEERHKMCAKHILASCKNSCINEKNNDGYTALHLAAMSQRDDIVELLVENGADIHIQTNEGATPLFVSTDLKISKYLIEKGAKIDILCDEGCTLLFSANSIALYEYYLSLGFDINAKDNDGYTVLHVELLNDGKPELIRFLLEHGANPNTPTNEGHVALHCVQDMNTLDLVCQHGAVIDIQDTFHGYTALHRFLQRGCPQFAQKLIEKGALWNIPDLDGKTALQCACLKGYTKLIQKMLENE